MIYLIIYMLGISDYVHTMPAHVKTVKNVMLAYNKSLHIRTYFFEREAEIGSYFKGTNTS